MHSYVLNANGIDFLVYGDETFFTVGSYSYAPGRDCLVLNDMLQIWVWPDGTLGVFGNDYTHIPPAQWDSDMAGFGATAEQIRDAWTKFFPDRPYTLVNV